MSAGHPADGPWVGRPLRRFEDPRLLRGEGSFVDDLAMPGMAHMVVIRSPFAHARVRRVEVAPALARAGVIGALTAGDLHGVVGSMPVRADEGSEVAPVPIPLLADGMARFAGEPVAALIAETRAAAEDAAELVDVEYDPLPVLVDPVEAMRSEVLLHEAAPGNVLLRWRASSGDVAGAFAAARRVVRGTFRIPRLVAAPIEPRGCVAAHDPADDLLTLWCSAQDPHRPRSHLAHVLGRPAERIRVVVPDVGGAFGSKGSLAPEHAVAAVAAIRWGRPVKWVEDRSENFVGAYQGRGVVVDAELAVDADGRFLGLRARVVADLGAYLYPPTAVVPVTVATLSTGAYDIPAAEVEVLGAATNKVPTGPYRGAGRPEAAFVAERMADLAAADLGQDPVAIRLLNFVPPERFPFRSALGLTYDSGDYAGALQRACELLPYERWRRDQRSARADGRLVGVGVSLFVERAAPGGWESAAASLGADGRVVVRTGSSPHGQGHETAFAQIAADAIGVDPHEVEVRHGDSGDVPPGVGTFGSRSITLGGSAVAAALEEVKAKARAVAAHLLEVAEDDLRWDGARFVVAGSPGLAVSIRDVARATGQPGRLSPHVDGRLEAETTFAIAGPVFPSGAHGVVVEIDPETGALRILRLVAVDDAGTIVNPLLAEGQVHGSILQGLAASVSEEAAYDEEGQLLTGSFATYGIPSAADLLVHPVSEFRATPSPLDPLGAKGIGESGTIGVPAAVAGAVADALAPLGVRHVDPPFTPEKLWRLIRDRSLYGAASGADKGRERP